MTAIILGKFLGTLLGVIVGILLLSALRSKWK